MSQEMQQAQQLIASLKIRLFDAGEHLANTQAQAKEFSETLTKIVQIVGVQPAEGAESIELSTIVSAVEALVPAKEETK
ncbi:gp57A [Aeromonas phage 31]|uniref:Molecular chaperone for both short and long tail fibers n=4 Tax=Biquartavirus TaxID=1912143 RepID=Q6U9H0_9CAUD|nr:tail fiber chaperone [Aeromonas phage 44RR2.8t]YP_238859.1 tail fiber chaperone [Aeromonas phage 31]APU00604.1 tail fibers chaperone [Aeromonas phage 44RR2.8t.2]APU01025.1 tail fibers chaperone [Aeromonas phage 31.2]APU01934.1 tail fibers chaperone [Aeromonas phage L9-6]APU02186.1 tail fibers chaperone [Aeromonas phage Riv-10]APU02432.1 tail fibers chaperone [Aeromonas phage SW69-9]UYD59686.1 hypothetical protein JNMOADIG_00174 [Aeromonas phage avDM5]UYD60584.1 hypothetical protein NPHMP